MTNAAVPAPRRGWWWPVLAVLCWLIVADLPIAHTLLPVHQPLLLLLPMLAVCALAGWWKGGSMPMAMGFTAAAAGVVFEAVRNGVSSVALSAAWSIIAASCLGLSLLASRSKWFLGKGVVAVLAALLLAVVLVAATPSGPASLARTVGAALEVRGGADLNNWRAARSQMTRGSTTRADSATTAMLDMAEQTVTGLPALARSALPSLLALQTLVAMAMAWALFHRVSRTRLGEPLAPVREFRFSDHWIWSVIAGLVIALLPALQVLQPLGINLLVFFGALYALRGAAVLAWFLRPSRSLLGLLIGMALLLLLRESAAIALGFVGLGDTWADWRRRIRPAVS